MEDEEEELDGGTVQPPTMADEDEEEELDGGTVQAPLDEDDEEEELDGGTVASVDDLFAASDQAYAAATERPEWAPPGKQGGQVTWEKRKAETSASTGKRFKDERRAIAQEPPPPPPVNPAERGSATASKRFVSGGDTATEASEAFGGSALSLIHI